MPNAIGERRNLKKRAIYPPVFSRLILNAEIIEEQGFEAFALRGIAKDPAFQNTSRRDI